MTRDEMWNLFDEIFKSWPCVDWDLVEVDFKANSPERKFYRKAWEALANHDGKTLREVKNEVADYLKKHKGTLQTRLRVSDRSLFWYYWVRRRIIT